MSRVKLNLGVCTLLIVAITGCSDRSTGPQPQPPVADPGGPYNAVLGAPVEFDGSASKDPDGGRVTSYTWDFGDGQTSTQATPQHIYASPGSYTVSLVVRNALGQSSTPSTTSAVIRPLEIGSLIRDRFERDEDEGWGMPEIGDRWRTSQVGGFSVKGGAGLITMTERDPRVVRGTGGYGVNVAGITSFSVDRHPDHFHRFQVYARRNDREGSGENWYRFQVWIPDEGNLGVRIERRVAGDTTWLTENETIGVPFEAGAKYWVRWQALGTSPSTVLRMKVWRDGTDEPAEWHQEVVSDAPGLDLSGTTGIRVTTSPQHVTYPIVFAVDNLDYVEREP